MNREARAAAALSHPNLITVHDYGSDGQGPYLVMELAEGPTLQQAVSGLAASEVLDIGAQVADGLAAIHSAGIIHRDVKPANVILSDRGPLLTDFGIALDPTDTAQITAEGMVVATPSYAAPEVMAGEPPTQASDVYSLAMTVRESLEAAGGSPDAALDDSLGVAMASDPAARPDAPSFAAALRGASPTVEVALPGAAATGPGGTDPTLIMAVPPTLASTMPENPEREGSRVPGALLLLAVPVLLLAGALAINGRNESGSAVAPATSTTEVSTTIAVTSTTPPTTSTTGAPVDAVQESRDRIAFLLGEPPRSDMNQREVDRVMRDIDEAIATAQEGNAEKAMDKLEKVAETFDEKLEGANREDALAELERLATSLGLANVSEDEDD
jgi:serine/threonine protein kinase